MEDESFVTGVAVNPATFHLECVDHLCYLENEVQQVGKTKGPSVAKIVATRNMLTETLEFAQLHLEQKAVRNLTQAIQTVFSLTKVIEEELHSGSAVSRFFGRAKTTAGGSAEKHQQLLASFQKLMAGFFVLCVQRFHTEEESKKSFFASVDAFLSELQRVWE